MPRLSPTELLAAARQNLRELTFLAETSSGRTSLGFLGAVHQGKRVLANADADLDTVADALRTLVLWCEIGIDTPGHALCGKAGMAERFLTVELDQSPVVANAPSHSIVFTDDRLGDPPSVQAEITVGTTEFTASGADQLAAVQNLRGVLHDQMGRIQAAIVRVGTTADDIERHGVVPPQPAAEGAMSPEVAYMALHVACHPFYCCVFNDNGDVSLSTGRLGDADWLSIKEAVAASATDSLLKTRAQPFADCVRFERGQVHVDDTALDFGDWVALDRAYRDNPPS